MVVILATIIATAGLLASTFMEIFIDIHINVYFVGSVELQFQTMCVLVVLISACMDVNQDTLICSKVEPIVRCVSICCNKPS